MTGRLELWLYMVQRVSAMLMAPLIIVHLVTIVYAIQGGLSAAEILGRTQGSVVWMLFYGLFVIAASVHGAIGLRNILREMTRWRGRSLDWSAAGFALVVLLLGLNAVRAVT